MLKGRRERLHVCILLHVLLLCPEACVSAGEVSSEQVRTLLGDDKYVAEVLEARKRLIRSLLLVIGDKKARMRIRARAVTLIGEIRAREAVATLISNLHVIRPEFTKEIVPEKMFPCLAALRKIGKPCTRPLLDELKKRNPKGRTLLLTHALLKVEGGRVARFLLEDELASVKSGKEKTNLQASIELLRRLDAGHHSGEKRPLNKRDGQT